MSHQASQASSKKWLLIRYWIPVFIYCGIIVYLSSQSYPSRNLPSFLFALSDKLVHGIEFGILGILLYRAFHLTTSTIPSITLTIICVMTFGISDEVHQWFVPHRHPDIWDVVADTVGAILFVFAWVFLFNKTDDSTTYKVTNQANDISQ